jgi:hypothetical protein
MTEIKIYTDKYYEKYMISPSEICFVANEKDLKNVASLHLSKTIGENIEVLKKFKEIKLEKTTLIETKTDGKLLYLIVGDFFKEAQQLKCEIKA